ARAEQGQLGGAGGAFPSLHGPRPRSAGAAGAVRVVAAGVIPNRVPAGPDWDRGHSCPRERRKITPCRTLTVAALSRQTAWAGMPAILSVPLGRSAPKPRLGLGRGRGASFAT